MIFVIEVPKGLINNQNVKFSTSNSFKRNSLRVFMNGILVNPNVENIGYTEINEFKFVMETAPEEGDDLQVYYLPI